MEQQSAEAADLDLQAVSVAVAGTVRVIVSITVTSTVCVREFRSVTVDGKAVTVVETYAVAVLWKIRQQLQVYSTGKMYTTG